MKKILQLSLFSFLVLASYFFYVNFLKINEQSNIKNKIGIKNDNLSETQNNLIKNLEYKVKFDNIRRCKTFQSHSISSSNTRYAWMQKY